MSRHTSPPPAVPSASVAVVIVNYETSDMVRRCLRSLADQELPHRVVVVDNPSPKNDGANLQEFDQAAGEAGEEKKRHQVRLVRAPENVGYGLGCNLGLEGSDAPYVCILNPDTQLPPGSLQAWVAAMQQEEKAGRKVGLLAPALLNENGTVQRSTYQFQTALNYWAYHSLFAGVAKTVRKRLPARPTRPTSSGQIDRGAVVPAQNVDWVMGAALLLPREAWEEVGGFSPAYFLYAEDTDLCWRLHKSGWEVLYQPEIAIIHTQGEPSPERRGQSLVRLFRGLQIFTCRNYGFWKRIGVCVAVIADMLIRISLYAPLRLLRPGHTMTRSRLEGSVAVLKMFLAGCGKG